MSSDVIVKTWWFDSSSSNKTYETLQYDDGSTSCNCRGWTMKKAGKERTCRHTRMVEGGLADSEATRFLDRQANQSGTQTAAARSTGTRKTQKKVSVEKPVARKIQWKS